MNDCAFFYVNIPAISDLEWHPFSAIRTLDGHSIGFCIKALKSGSFVDQVVQHAKVQHHGLIKIRLEGPYGQPSVNIYDYDVAVLVCGGIGVTPMANIINQVRLKEQSSSSTSTTVKIHLHWGVKDPSDLLVADKFMYPLPAFVSPHFYVSNAKKDSGVSSLSGETISYRQGRMVAEEIINPERYLDARVCVMVCGPDSLAWAVQCEAQICNFDFHKEVFLL